MEVDAPSSGYWLLAQGKLGPGQFGPTPTKVNSWAPGPNCPGPNLASQTKVSQYNYYNLLHQFCLAPPELEMSTLSFCREIALKVVLLFYSTYFTPPLVLPPASLILGGAVAPSASSEQGAGAPSTHIKYIK